MAEFHLTGGWSVVLLHRVVPSIDGQEEETYAQLRVAEYARDSEGQVLWPPHTVMVGTFGSPGELRELIHSLEDCHATWMERAEAERLQNVARGEAAYLSGWNGVDYAYMTWRRTHPVEEDGIAF